jgi:uncharacterized protein YeaO (DUF488 family)
MRRVKPEFEFDLWLPHLSPSTELLQRYQEENLPWEDFQAAFLKETETKEKYYSLIDHLLSFTDVTLLCVEETSERCHRRIVGELLEEKLKIKINFD